ncbi:TerC family protein [Wolbachia endosymbiont of Cruorifilaria tuberocauda]|uniref:TerC family protein n=1 Tax=Wolbachia endosymbiont of Cruorifilaria tuberocauda TaxID=1812111 RepID=UPI00158A218B|nr:TerC family protein [Wolbachia endosymbiont of Cruorifilaria tuberocauda]QKX01458.1 TerC family protein [Wolbachia endosymbiont of Cruorifilaria tuberocauda]
MLDEVQTLLILILLETLLNVDNLIFISLSLGNVSNALKKRVRLISLGLALLMRFVALFSTSYILSMQKPILHIMSLNISVKDLLMIVGGLFLFAKSSMELWNNISLYKQPEKKIDTKSRPSLIVLQITLTDLIFSVDSLLTAIAFTHNTAVIAIAYMFSILAIIFLSSYITQITKFSFSLKTIAILFILLASTYLILEGLHIELSKGHLYFSLIFALLVEAISNIKKKVRYTEKRK